MLFRSVKAFHSSSTIVEGKPIYLGNPCGVVIEGLGKTIYHMGDTEIFGDMAKIGKPWRVDNECKGKLDDVAKNLQQNADNKLVIVGNAEPTEKRKNLAAERAVNSKAYLTGGEAKLGIDPSRIETRTGSSGTKTAEYWIVPAGGTFSGEGTQVVDESVVKAVPDHPHAAGAKKAKPAAQ